MVPFILLLFHVLFYDCDAFPQQGIWNTDVNEKKNFVAVTKTVYNHTELFINIICFNDPKKSAKINISYTVQILQCYEEEILDEEKVVLSKTELSFDIPQKFFSYTSPNYSHLCSSAEPIQLPHIDNPTFDELQRTTIQQNTSSATTQAGLSNATQASTPIQEHTKKKQSNETSSRKRREPDKKQNNPISQAGTKNENQNSAVLPKPILDTSTTLPQMYLPSDGVYTVQILISPATSSDSFNASVVIKMHGMGGYLSAVDWPFLPFYGVMCGLYVLYGVIWLVVSACQWRDLLRIQFWIGGVILLGMLEKAVFYAEYQSINSTGHSVQGAVMFAEVVSCLKRTLARMLVIIVSLGFGIVKPRLGPLLHRVVGVGALYFIVSVVEASMRVYKLRTDPYRQLMLAEILLAVIDSFICWWIFSSLVQTTRTLRLRRNVVKLSLYRHFTNTLIFAVLASVAFMVWSLKNHRQPQCMTDWKELWVDEAYWRLLFSVILLVIMILWRPTNNNQRYAFTPLLDAPDDDEDETVMSDAFEGMKMRNKNSPGFIGKDGQPKGVEEDLKWVEENIPTTIADVALPSLLDSDEEIMTTKFEMSKMN